MITPYHYIWFHHIAEKRNLNCSARALYFYLADKCAWSNGDNVHLTQEAMASALHVSKSTVNSSLKKLQEARLISGTKGHYTIMQPDNDWIQRYYLPNIYR
ncbi:MAG: winged helix-turn-helix domain-containing protein [Quinella sp. 3Q1]|nr:winged helix-turn-helix domain-containing protein [Quinella sp. 3Q1]MBR6888925.1 winged helix-turn-helix domain-containing protein [Selenomonadaceae bacterium]